MTNPSREHRLREEQKRLRDKYLAVAKNQLLAETICALKIPNHASVHIMQDGGAWVDAQIWVPKEAIE